VQAPKLRVRKAAEKRDADSGNEGSDDEFVPAPAPAEKKTPKKVKTKTPIHGKQIHNLNFCFCRAKGSMPF
jgi:hypothetical protein